VDAETLARLLSALPDAVVFADREGVIRYWNEGAVALFGHRQEDALGRSLDLIIPTEFREAHWQGYRRAMERGDTKYRGQAMPTRSMRADGSRLYVEMTLGIVKDATGQAVGVVAVMRDITRRREEERALRKRLEDLTARLAELGATPPPPAGPTPSGGNAER